MRDTGIVPAAVFSYNRPLHCTTYYKLILCFPVCKISWPCSWNMLEVQTVCPC